MAGCLRPAAGFYGGGGGVTPSPTPQVPDGSAYWRPVTLGGTVFKALVDSFGRLYTHEEESVVSGFAWSAEGEQLPDFDNAGRYSAAFSDCYNNWGHNNKLVEFTGNTAIFEYNGQQIPLVYDDLSGEITPNVPQMTNGTPDIFIRTLNDGTADVKVLVSGDGTLLTHDGSYFLVNSESGEITVEDDATKLAALTEAAGVAVTVDEFVEDTDGFFKIVNNGYTVIVNFDGNVTFGSVSAWPLPNNKLYAITIDDTDYLGTSEGKPILLKFNNSEQFFVIGKDGDAYNFLEDVGTVPTENIQAITGTSSDNTIINFEFGGVSYRLNNTKYEDPTWITPNNITAYE